MGRNHGSYIIQASSIAACIAKTYNTGAVEVEERDECLSVEEV
jgi:hypothetical protein